MNRKKYGLIIITTITVGVLLSILLFGNIDFRKLTTDSGFDSSWDSGGSSWSSSSSSGSSWSSSSDSSSGYSSIDYSELPLYIFIPVSIIVIIILLALIEFIIKISSKKESYEDSNSSGEKLSETVPKLSNEEIELLNKYGFNEKKVLDDAYRIYVDIQEAWSKNKIEEAKDVLSNELFNTYKSQIEVLKTKNERNEMSDFNYLDSAIASIKEEDNTLSVSVFLKVSCKDYLVDSKTNSVKRGSESKINYYYYKLDFIVPGENHYFDKCPNCNSQLPEDEVNIVCNYCGSSIVRKLNKMILTRKQMIEQH